MNRAECHERLPRSTFGDDARSLCLAQILRGAGDGERLSWKCLAQKCCERRSNGVFLALQWRVRLENAFGQQGTELTQILKGGLHGDTS